MSLGGANRTDQAIGRNPADIAGDGWEARVVRSERERDRPTPWSHLAQQLGRTEEYLRRVYGGQFVEPPAGVLVIITRAPEPIEPSTPRGRPRKVPGMAPALSPSGAVLPIRPKSLEARVLFVLAGAQAALSPTEIAPRIGRGRHVVSNVLRALANKSLITRRRRSEWVTSDAGRALAVELMTMGGADG